MGNYTDVKLKVLIKPEYREQIVNLDKWIKATPIYNPHITPDYNWKEEVRICKDNSELVFQIYPHDSHLFFHVKNSDSIISLGGENGREAPAWYSTENGSIVLINALFRNYWNQLALFLNWLSPMVEQVLEGEYDTDDDLEGMRPIVLDHNELVIGGEDYDNAYLE